MKRFAGRTVAQCLLVLLMGSVFDPIRLLAQSPPEEWKAPSRAARRKNPIPADAKSVAAGKTVYAAQCLSCHGPQGHGDGTAAKDLNPRPRDLSDPAIQQQTDGSIFWKLTEGRKPMPTFEKLISEDDRWSVINYVRTLKGKAGR